MFPTILVTGASGKLGRQVVHHLLETQKVPAAHLIATTRNPAELSDLAAKGVNVRAANFDDETSLATAFEGADRVLIISTDQIGQRVAQHKSAIAAAAKAGASHVAYTSMPKPEPANPVLFAPDHFATEQAVKESGLAYTIFRNNWYLENLLMSLPPAFATGKWYTSASGGRTAHIAREDIARAIAASLASDTAGSATYTLTGAEALTNEEIASLAGDITGTPVEVVNVSDEQLAEGMKAAGVPEAAIPLLVSFDVNARVGGLDDITDDVERLTGAKPRSHKAFLEENLSKRAISITPDQT